MKLLCQRCGHRGGSDLAFIWHGKTFKVKGSERTLWLCPDCIGEFASNEARNRFLREQLK